MKTTDEQRAELRRKQQAATPGPWRLAGTADRPCPVVSATHREKGYQVHSMLHVKDDEPDVWTHMRETFCRDAAFIAAANPETVGALLDDVDELRAQLDDARHVISEMEKNREEAIDITTRREYAQQAEIDELRERVRALEAEREEDQGVIRVWRGRTERAEAERDRARNDALEAAAEPLAGRGPYVQVNAAAEAARIRSLKRSA